MSLLVAAGEIWTNPIIVGLVVGIPGSYLGWKGYRHTMKMDVLAAQAALAPPSGAIQQVIDGLNSIIENLQEDNEGLRGSLARCRENLERLTANPG